MMNMNGVLLHTFQMGNHEWRAYFSEATQTWLLKNSRAAFAFTGKESLGEGRIKATLRRLLTEQYAYLRANSDRVIVRIDSDEGYLDTFPFSQQKRWLRGLPSLA